MTAAKRTQKTRATGTSPAQAGERTAEVAGPESTQATPLVPIVGIGASAGGLEALSTFFKALSPDLGMAFVLVPHLDPHRESSFAQILARTTSMQVLQIENEMRVVANRVYVIPPNCELTIDDSVLQMTDRERVGNTTIDHFMRSLAADQGVNAVGVVLSGTGADGTAGLTAIKGEGGITLAQEPHSAKYDAMPASAIAAGCVDFILPPEGIAKELARISRHPHVAALREGPVDGDGSESASSMAQIYSLLRRVAKVDFSNYKPPTIGRRIQRRMVLHKIVTLADYVTLLHRDRAEINALYQDLLINVTSFFRNPEAFEALKQIVYPAILQSRGSSSSPIRIWAPGCSTGEETYSHAISLTEFLGDERLEVPIQIFGTDLSENAIQRSRVGVYKESIEADVSPTRLRRFFHKSDGGYQISKTIRDLCIFSTQNVFSDPPFSRMDLVSCRNVMIYLGQPLQRKVIPIFHYALKPTGFLMIGNTEGLVGAGSELFEMSDKKQKIYRKKPASIPVTFGFAIGESDVTDGREAPALLAKPLDGVKEPLELQREADRLLIGRYAPPAVVVNDQLEIIQTRGRTGTYLELPRGKASLNLLKMARPGLLYELRSAIEEARKTATETRRENVHVDGNGIAKPTTVRVIPFKTPVQETHNYLIVFESNSPETDDHSIHRPAVANDAEMPDKDKQLLQLQQELAASKEYLQSIIETQEATNEELQSANEEIQSGNEELQSANEELQTSKEELESANEELHTVNEEMLHRNELLAQLNNDLTNLLNSVNFPMVMVGADLSVRRFTPQATAVLGLMPSDVGRPMPRLKLKIDAASLEQTMLDVIQEVQPKNSRVRDQEGEWCTLRINPYRTLDNRIDGVVLMVLDSRTIGDASIAVQGNRERPKNSLKTPSDNRKNSVGNGKRKPR